MLYIRPARQEDQEVIAQIHVEAWLAAYRKIVPPKDLARGNLAARMDFWGKELSKARHGHFIALEQGGPVGFFSLETAQDPDLPAGTLELAAIYFSSGQWRKGYGTQCMSYILSHARENGYRHIALWVLEENRSARAFYEKIGFCPDGTSRPVGPDSPVREVRYRIEL